LVSCKISKIFGKSLWENVNFLDPCKHKFLDRRRGVLTLFLYGHVTFFDRFIVSSCNECFVNPFISLAKISGQGRKSVEAKFRKTGFLKKKLEFWPDFIWENLAKISTIYFSFPVFQKVASTVFRPCSKIVAGEMKDLTRHSLHNDIINRLVRSHAHTKLMSERRLVLQVIEIFLHVEVQKFRHQKTLPIFG